MATRQYIGARYVPKFFEGVGGSTEWVSGVQYEPLTIVTHLGNSYTSKKPVPVGIDILNEEYWVNTGNYNAQIEEYRQEVSLLKNRKFLFVGDSYAESPSVSDNWCLKVAEALNLDYNDYDVEAYSGGGFTVGGGNQFLEALQRTASWSLSKKKTITDVVICGGYNDAVVYGTYENLIVPHIKACVDYVKTNFPNAKVSIGFIGNGKFSSPSTPSTLNFVNYYNTIYYYKLGAKQSGASYLRGSEAIMHDYNYIGSDGIHPNTIGSSMLGANIANALITGDCAFQNGGSYAQLNAISGVTLNSETSIFMGIAEISNDVTSWNGGEVAIEKSDGLELGYTFTKFCDFNCAPMFCNEEQIFNVESVGYWSNETGLISRPLRLRIYRGALYLATADITTHTLLNVRIYVPKIVLPVIDS